MSATPPQQPGRIERGYSALTRALARIIVDIVLPITAVVIIYAILFGKVKDVSVALMLGGAASAFLGIPFWTRQDRARRNGSGDDGGGGFTISIGRGAAGDRSHHPDDPEQDDEHRPRE